MDRTPFWNLKGVFKKVIELKAEVNTMKLGLFSKQVALNLGISPNTLRRWCLELEKQNYEFERNENEQRIFYDRDIVTLSEVQKLLNQRQSMESATKAVAIKFKDKKNAEIMMSVIDEKSDIITLSKTQLQEMLDQAAEQGSNLALEKFNSTIEQRDHSLIRKLNESFEQRQLENSATVKENFFSKVFNFKKRK